MAKGTTARGGSKAAMPASIKQNERMEVRAISNGYIVSRSGVDGKGNYYSKEMYSKTNPVKIK